MFAAPLPILQVKGQICSREILLFFAKAGYDQEIPKI